MIEKMKKVAIRVLCYTIPLLLFSGCVRMLWIEGKTYRRETVSYYLGATVLDSKAWIDERREEIFHSKYYTERRTTYTNMCTVKVAYEDGYVKVLEEREVNPELCLLLKEGDWVDGWRTDDLRIHRETGETEILNAIRTINLREELEKRWPYY